MKITDQGFIVSIKKFSETKAIISFLTENNGILSGIVNNINSKNNISTYQIGNFVNLIWQARLEEHLGKISAELKKSIPYTIMEDREKLNSIVSILSIIYHVLAEKVIEKEIFYNLYNYIITLLPKNIKSEIWYKDYCLLELLILEKNGYGLDLKKCAVTQKTEGLFYLSPKTGKSVIKEAGLPYKDKLFVLPNFFIKNNAQATIQDILFALTITGYFIENYFFKIKHLSLPQNRQFFVNIIKNKEIK